MSLLNKGSNHPLWGKKHSDETKFILSQAHKNNNNPMYGKTHSLETREKMSELKQKKVLIQDFKTKKILYTCDSITKLADFKHKSTVGRYIKNNKIWKNKYIFINGK
jgi:group I intron endonuclease